MGESFEDPYYAWLQSYLALARSGASVDYLVPPPSRKGGRLSGPDRAYYHHVRASAKDRMRRTQDTIKAICNNDEDAGRALELIDSPEKILALTAQGKTNMEVEEGRVAIRITPGIERASVLAVEFKIERQKFIHAEELLGIDSEFKQQADEGDGPRSSNDPPLGSSLVPEWDPRLLRLAAKAPWRQARAQSRSKKRSWERIKAFRRKAQQIIAYNDQGDLQEYTEEDLEWAQEFLGRKTGDLPKHMSTDPNVYYEQAQKRDEREFDKVMKETESQAGSSVYQGKTYRCRGNRKAQRERALERKKADKAANELSGKGQESTKGRKGEGKGKGTGKGLRTDEQVRRPDEARWEQAHRSNDERPQTHHPRRSHDGRDEQRHGEARWNQARRNSRDWPPLSHHRRGYDSRDEQRQVHRAMGHQRSSNPYRDVDWSRSQRDRRPEGREPTRQWLPRDRD